MRGRPSNSRGIILSLLKKDPRMSIRELCQASGLKHPSTVWYHLDKLEQDGKITKRKGARGIYIGEHIENEWHKRNRDKWGTPMRVMRDRRNKVSSTQRSANGRKGRGENAFEGNDGWWKKTMRRIDRIAERANGTGGGVDVMHDPIHAHRRTLKAKKF